MNHHSWCGCCSAKHKGGLKWERRPGPRDGGRLCPGGLRAAWGAGCQMLHPPHNRWQVGAAGKTEEKKEMGLIYRPPGRKRSQDLWQLK